jgi:cation transport ATPase-like protein
MTMEAMTVAQAPPWHAASAADAVRQLEVDVREGTVTRGHARVTTITVSGQGYSTEGRIRTTDGSPLPETLERALLAMTLCSDSELRDREVIGDPTEGALLVLAEKGGIDTSALRRDKPRLAEVPFDSDYKFMATFHRWTDRTGTDVVRCFVKGAPDVLAGMADRYLGATDIAPLDHTVREGYARGNTELAEQGMRVLAIGAQDFTPADLQGVSRPAPWPSPPLCSSRCSTCSTSATTGAACSAATPWRTAPHSSPQPPSSSCSRSSSRWTHCTHS